MSSKINVAFACVLILLMTKCRAIDLVEAVASGNVTEVEQLLADPEVNPNQKSADGWPCLTIAVLKGYTDIIDKLLGAKANPDIANQHGQSPLMFAVYSGNPVIIEKLLARGANPNIADSEGQTPLMFVVAKGDMVAIEKLLEAGADPDIIDQEGDTLLIVAITDHDRAIAQKLLDAGADPNKANRKGQTPLALAVSLGDFVLTEKLLADPEVNPNQTNADGWPCLTIAVIKGYTDIIDKLLAKGADPYQIDQRGRPALTLAVSKGYVETTEKLLAARMANNYLKIPEKCSFLTFSQSDSNNAIVGTFIEALSRKIVAMSSTYILRKSLQQFPFIRGYFESKKWSLFLNKSRDFGLVVPESITDVHQLREKYGFKNVEYVQPKDVGAVLSLLTSTVQADQFDTLIRHFSNCIDDASPNHVTRFYLSGHGKEKDTIAAVPLKDIGKLFNVFSDIDTEFLYIFSCETAGSNLVVVQSELQAIVEKQLKENVQKQIDYELYERGQSARVYGAETYRSPDLERESIEPEMPQRTKGINYMIVIQATSGVSTSGVGGLNKFFTRLNESFRKGPITSKELVHILEPMPKSSIALPSVRWPGTTTFFRSANLGKMEIITMNKLQSWRLEKLSSYKEVIRKQRATISQLQNELSELVQKKLTKDTQIIAKGEELEERKRMMLMEHIGKAKARLKEILQIEIPISASTEYIQVFPCDLSDCSFTIIGSSAKFISKIPGRSQHFIGKVRDLNLYESFIAGANHFADSLDPFREFAKTCWFIQSLDLRIKDKVGTLENIVIFSDPRASGSTTVAVAFGSPGRGFRVNNEVVGQEEFTRTIRSWFISSLPSYSALYEATGGRELSFSPEEKIPPQFGRGYSIKATTPGRAFNWFIKGIKAN